MELVALVVYTLKVPVMVNQIVRFILWMIIKLVHPCIWVLSLLSEENEKSHYQHGGHVSPIDTDPEK